MMHTHASSLLVWEKVCAALLFKEGGGVFTLVDDTSGSLTESSCICLQVIHDPLSFFMILYQKESCKISERNFVLMSLFPNNNVISRHALRLLPTLLKH